MKNLFVRLLLTFLFLAPAAALAQSGSRVVAVCGTLPAPYAAGSTQPPTVDVNGVTCSNSSGGGGGAVTIADGADVTQGAIADAASTAGGAGTLSAKLRLMTTQLGTINTTLGSPFQAGGSIANTAFGISGTLPAFGATPTFNCGTGCFQTTQPISAAALPLPTGAATSALQSTINTTLGTPMQQTGGSVTASQGGAWNINNISGTISLPTGAATSAAQITMATNQTAVQGPIPGGAATATKSNITGGENRTTPPTLTDGQQAPTQMGTRGSIKVELAASNSTATPNFLTLGADAASNTATGMIVYTRPSLYNGATGTTWDRQTNNFDTAALITLSAAGAGTTNSADQTNFNGRGVQVGANITVAGGTIAVTVNIQGKDVASGVYYTMLSSTSLVGTGFTNLTVYPGAGITANVSASMPLPRTWRVQVVSGAGVTPAVTMTVGASVIN